MNETILVFSFLQIQSYLIYIHNFEWRIVKTTKPKLKFWRKVFETLLLQMSLTSIEVDENFQTKENHIQDNEEYHFLDSKI